MNDLPGLGIQGGVSLVSLTNLVLSGVVLWLLGGTVAIVVYRLIRGPHKDKSKRDKDKLKRDEQYE
ncbi:MAG: hypothetical protein IT298_04090 [Chloroflexi bacterium]|jgi:hypothetical protein|nr:MAG: hypothetical protein UZ13_03766 [Chloroflexi bacterium OLB13]MBC6955612.1 hypothetical protein [Chloroflexota bacterium]MBV6437222.1 hypothetical protein [Anaerolineae bacterium]MDL1914918.1 hypothetical protein [Anaerolineae bacterium CFX4]OQY84965.1 MAG: hypothetical protein B6D42_04310 [Anaerolineae bacterium UTCFX5]